MSRVRLHPLPDYPFQCRLVVRTTDLNYGGHLGNDRLLALVHEARVAFLASHGQKELDCGGVSLIMSDVAMVFQREAFAGDVLRLEVKAGEPTPCGFRLFFRITRPADAATIALVENGMVCFDYRERRVKGLPALLNRVCAERV